jgi:hypothetical protein
VVIVVAAWMLDPVACAGMEMGAPRVAVTALVELHHLLIDVGFRRNSRDDSLIAQEEQDAEIANTDFDKAAVTANCAAPAEHDGRRLCSHQGWL